MIAEGTAAFRRLEHRLEGSDQTVKYVLVGVIAVSLFLIFQPSRMTRLAGALWLILP
jgi:hypothetical protein